MKGVAKVSYLKKLICATAPDDASTATNVNK